MKKNYLNQSKLYKSCSDLSSSYFICVADLVGALEKGASGKKNRFLRAVFRRAVELQYDQSKAEARLVALTSGKYQVDFESKYYHPRAFPLSSASNSLCLLRSFASIQCIEGF